MRNLLLAFALLSTSVTAETAIHTNALACFEVDGYEFISDDIQMNALAKGVVTEFSKQTPHVLSISTATGFLGSFRLSPEQAALPLETLMDECDRQADMMARRNAVLKAAFAVSEGLSCFTDGNSLLLSGDQSENGIGLSEVTGFDKKVPDQLTIQVGKQNLGPYILPPLQAALPLDQLIIGCALKANERPRRTLSQTD